MLLRREARCRRDAVDEVSGVVRNSWMPNAEVVWLPEWRLLLVREENDCEAQSKLVDQLVISSRWSGQKFTALAQVCVLYWEVSR
jgi:hypothetical protein